MKKLFLVFVLVLFIAQFSQAQWEPDVRLTNMPGSSLIFHGLASSGDSLHIVWWDDRDGNQEIYYKRSVDGGVTWGADIQLTNQPDDKEGPVIALSGSVVHVKWIVYRDGFTDSYYKRSTDGGNTWGPDIQITNTPGFTFGYNIAASGSFVHMVNNDKGEGVWNIYYYRSIDGGLTWEPDVKLTNDPSASLNPMLFVSGSIVHVVWDDYRDGNKEIYYKRSTNGGLNWGPDIRLTDDAAFSYLPCVGASGSGVYVVWVDERDGNREIYFKYSIDEGLNWGEDYRLTNNWGDSDFPNIAVSGTGIFVTWTDYSVGNLEIYYKCSTDGGINWGPDKRLTSDWAESKYSCLSISGPQVNVVWSDNRDGNYEIYYKRNPTGNIIVGIEDDFAKNVKQQFNIYPNPARTVLNIDFNSVSSENLTLKFIDINGWIVGMYNFNSSPGLNKYPIHVNDFDNGLYFIELTHGTNRIFKKVIINK